MCACGAKLERPAFTALLAAASQLSFKKRKSLALSSRSWPVYDEIREPSAWAAAARQARDRPYRETQINMYTFTLPPPSILSLQLILYSKRGLASCANLRLFILLAPYSLAGRKTAASAAAVVEEAWDNVILASFLLLSSLLLKGKQQQQMIHSTIVECDPSQTHTRSPQHCTISRHHPTNTTTTTTTGHNSNRH